MNEKIACNGWRVAALAGSCVLGAIVAMMMLSLPLHAQTAPASEANTRYPPNSSGPRNFEGVWWPSMGMGAGGAPPGGGPGGPGAAAPGGAPGGGPGGAPSVEGTTLQCTPVMRMSGSGGGMTTLIVQSDQQLVMASEEDMDIARKIYIGGAHPAADKLAPQPNGHSIGSWQGNTLVVDSIGYSGRDGKDNGSHVVERISKNGNTLTSEITTTDKNGNARKQMQTWAWRPDLQFNENVCEEGFDRYQIINGQLDNPNVPPSREGK
jgi:hypothetical protein